MKKKYYIKDLKIGDSLFGETFAVKSYKRGATRNNKPFIDIELSDNSGAIKGKVWSDDLSACDKVAEGDVVEVTATVEDFMGARQMKITNMKKTEVYELVELQQKTEFDVEKMWQDIEKTITGIKNPYLKNLLETIFDDETTDKFKKSPAAYKVHHNYLGGLLEHTWEMLKMTESVSSHYQKLNMDLLKTGVILHDIGKAFEFEPSTTILITNKGKLLGHIYLGAEIVKHHAPKDTPEDLLDEVLHIILAHHGQKEFGSPVVPMTAEAITVHVLDYSSAKMKIAYSQIFDDLGNEQFTQYVPQLGTELYRSPYSDIEVNEDIPF
jgi:3'-5' exoribonuclease